MKSIREHLTYANVVATLALFLVLSGGAAYAAGHLAKNSVGTKQLKNNAVTGAKVKDGSLGAKDFAAGSLPAGPKGDPGAAGVPGAPGSALGYAHIVQGELVAAESKGVVKVSEGVNASESEHIPWVTCFDLEFTPVNVIASAQAGFNDPGSYTPEFVAAVAPAEAGHGGAVGCPPGYRDAMVEAPDFNSNPGIGAYVLFN